MPLQIRPYSGPDEPALLRLWRAALPYEAVDAATFRRKVICDPNVGDGFVVAEQDGELVGLCLGIRRREAFGPQGLEPDQAWVTMFAVAEQARGRGVGTALFDAVEHWAVAHGAERMAIAPYVPNYFVPGLDVDRHAQGIAFLEARGYVPGSDALALDSRLVTIDFEPYFARLSNLAAEGLTIGTPTWAQVPALLRFLERETPHDWLRAARDQLQSAGLDDFTVACHNDAVIGYCQNDGEHFGPFGVSDGWRGRGLGTATLAHRLAMMRAAGRHHAWVLWTSQSTWERVYQRFGFTLTRRFRLLSKPLA